MNTNREKTSNVKGIAVSVILHGIFFAGCLALDASSMSASASVDPAPTEVNHIGDQANTEKVKS